MTQPQLPALELNGLAKAFRTRADGVVRAVEHVDLTVQPGEVVALLGPNGAGKTTTLDMVLGLTSPTSGVVSVFGRPPREAVTAGRVSAVLQSGGLLRDLSVRETVQMIASVFEDPRPIDEVMARAGLTQLAARKVLDIEMPGLDGLAVAEKLAVAAPQCRVLIVTTFSRPGYLRRALDAGAGGFVVKDTPARELAEAVRRVHAGLRVIDPALATESLTSGPNPLTEREQQVLREALSGVPVAQIAIRVHLTAGTVRNLSSAIGKTNTSTRAEAARVAQDQGWI